MSGAHLARCCCDDCEAMDCEAGGTPPTPPENMAGVDVLRVHTELDVMGAATSTVGSGESGSPGGNDRVVLRASTTLQRDGNANRWVYCYSDGTDTGGQSDACCTDVHPQDDPASAASGGSYLLTQQLWYHEVANCYQGVQAIGLRSLRVVVDYREHTGPAVEITSPAWRVRWLARLSGTLMTSGGLTMPWSRWCGGCGWNSGAQTQYGADGSFGAATPVNGFYVPMLGTDASLHCHALTERWGNTSDYIDSDCALAEGADADDLGYLWRSGGAGSPSSWVCVPPTIPPVSCAPTGVLLAGEHTHYPGCAGCSRGECCGYPQTVTAWIW